MKYLCTSLTLCLTLSLSALSGAREAIALTCIFEGVEAEYIEMKELYSEAFDNLGFDAALYLTSSKRAIADAASGASDGSCGRGYNFSENQRIENLVRVNTPVAIFHLQVWSKNKDLTFSKEQGFPKGARVGFLSGYDVTLQYLETQPEIIRLPITNDKIGYRMLAADRLDYLIAASITRHHANNTKNNQPLYPIGTLESFRLYPYLHAKHDKLVKPLEAELRRLIKEKGGLIDGQ